MAIIGIPSNHLNHPNPKHRTNYVDYTQQNYTAALREAGALPVVFPMGSPEEAAEYVNSVDAVLLIGGQDVGPLFYGEDPTPQMGETDRQRDLFELAIVAEARKQNKPLMGICRGAQLINVALGGTLIQDIDTQYTPENGNPIVKHDQFPVKWYEPTHRLDVLPDNFLTGTLGDNPTRTHSTTKVLSSWAQICNLLRLRAMGRLKLIRVRMHLSALCNTILK